MDAVVAAADRVGAWLLADEVYAGAERVQEEKTPSFWGRYDKVLAHASTSKAARNVVFVSGGLSPLDSGVGSGVSSRHRPGPRADV